MRCGMRYLLFFLFLGLYSHFVFSQAPQCTGLVGAPEVCGFTPEQSGGLLGQRKSACTNAGNILVSDGVCPEASKGRGTPTYKCYLLCSCPEGTTLTTLEQGSGQPSSCVPDTPPTENPDDECPAKQVMYENLCRDAEDSPEDCPNSASVSIDVNGQYVCTNNPSCPSGHSTNNYSNANGSWTTCSPPSGEGNSSDPSGGGNSSAPSSAPGTGSGGEDEDGDDTGGGSGSGSGSGNGTGNGSGNSSSSPSDAGTGDGDTGIGNGTAAAASCDGGEPECDGDPIQCAMLVQLWINNCAGFDEVELNNPVDDNEAIRDNFDALVSSAEPSVNAEGVLDAMTPGGGAGNGTGSGSGSGSGSGNGGGNGIDLSGLDSAANSGGGGSCPADRQISLSSGSYSISYQFFCDFASQVSGLVLLIFSYIGAMIIYRSLQW